MHRERERENVLFLYKPLVTESHCCLDTRKRQAGRVRQTEDKKVEQVGQTVIKKGTCGDRQTDITTTASQQ